MKVSLPLERAVIDYADFTGRTMAVDSVKLRARVWGHLEKINFTEGADVKKGDVLFIIDQRPYKAALTKAEADVAQSEARHKRLLSDLKRADGLAAAKAISTEDYDKIAGDASEAAAMVKSRRRQPGNRQAQSRFHQRQSSNHGPNQSRHGDGRQHGRIG